MNEINYITDLLIRDAQRSPLKFALVTDEKSLTWQQLYEEVIATAASLESKLPKSTDPLIVALLLPNSWQFVVTHLAILHLGHITMPIDPAFKKLEIDPLIEQMQPALTITSSRYLENFDGVEHRPILVDEVVASNDLKPRRLVRIAPHNHVATLLFTSGTTGRPKAAPYTHFGHIWNVQALTAYWQWSSDDTLLISVPLSHMHGLLLGVTGSLYHGNTLYLHEIFDPAKTVQLLETGKISIFMHVPIVYLKLVSYEPQKSYDFSQVRLFISGSSYLPPALWEQFKDRFGHEILERYGSSETGFITSNTVAERVPGCVGKVLPGVELKLMDDGEIALRSPGLFPGYYKNDEATKAKLTSDGMWLMGDIGEFKGDNLYLKSRVVEKIIKNGYTFYPRDIEWAMLANKKINDIFVLSIQDPAQLNDTLVYFIVSKLDENSVTIYCKQNLPHAWRPDKIIFLEEIPKTKSGKPKLAILRELATNQ